MPGIRKHGCAASLSSQPGLWIGRGLVRFVGALFPVEIAGWIASALRRVAVVVAFGLGLETLQRSPGLHQSAVDGEVLLGDQLRALGQAQDPLKEQPSHIGLQQPVAMVRES
jgi:hypothetical protein